MKHRKLAMLSVMFLCFAGTPGSVRAAQPADGAERPRTRDVGVAPGILAPGPMNAITDVGSVLVGHVTLIEGETIRTGATAILPHGGNLYREKVPAGVAVGNGYGKLVGVTQIQELGEIETAESVRRHSTFDIGMNSLQNPGLGAAGETTRCTASLTAPTIRFILAGL
jgi:hypothetical protein